MVVVVWGSSWLEIRLRTKVVAVLRAELAKSAFQFGLSEGTAQSRTVHFLRNLREAELANKLQGQRGGEVGEACWRIIDKGHGRLKTLI